MNPSIAALALAGILLAQMGGEVRIDTFDEHARRTGHVIVDPQTGRIDTFDTRSRRTGSSVISPSPVLPPAGSDADRFDRDRSRTLTIDKRLR